MIPLSFLIVIAGGILWVSTMHSNLSHATSEVKSLAETQISINQRLAKIEGQLDILLKRTK